MQEYQSTVRVLSGDSPLSKQISYGVIRDYYHLSGLLGQLLKKPLTGKNVNVHLLLLAGLYSVNNLNRPAHASVNATVNATKGLKLPWAKGLVNGVLRNYLRNQADIETSIEGDIQAQSNHPEWLLNRIKTAWPQLSISKHPSASTCYLNSSMAMPAFRMKHRNWQPNC